MKEFKDEDLEEVMGGDIPLSVYVPPTIKNKQAKVIIKQPKYKPESIQIRDNIVKINRDGDPIGFLIAVMNGSAIEQQSVQENGKIKRDFQVANLGQRIQIARFLANLTMPRLSVMKHIAEPQTGEDLSTVSMKQIIEMAASREDDDTDAG